MEHPHTDSERGGNGGTRMMCDVLQCEHNEDGFCCTSPFIGEDGTCETMEKVPTTGKEVRDEH